MIGMSIATTGVLFRNADVSAMGTSSRSCAVHSVFGRPRINFIIGRSNEVRWMPSATAKRTATVATPVLENPTSANCGVMTVNANRAVTAASIVTCVGIVPFTRNASIKSVIAKVSHAFHDSGSNASVPSSINAIVAMSRNKSVPQLSRKNFKAAHFTAANKPSRSLTAENDTFAARIRADSIAVSSTSVGNVSECTEAESNLI
mmetsp:Transcript_14230/g.38155  ORF Transcript_14230/g.38155 Transcript_14230/m.38155 type:complete len:204 (+) Transcript_14230:2494-3105(+)